MTVLLTTDWHLTDHARDAYRWELFPWLKTQQKKTGAKQLIVCGDITDAKDRHPLTLVNRLVKEIASLADVMDIIFIRGNHDGLNEGSAFFAFAETLYHKRVFYVLEPSVFDIDDGLSDYRYRKESVFLPSMKNWDMEWWNKYDLKGVHYIFCHQTFDGAKAENGVELRGVPPSVFDRPDFKGRVFSGDIHVPQQVGKVTYIGCPYRVHFGDRYKGRVLLLRKGEAIEIPTPFVSREVVTIRTITDLDRPLSTPFPKKTQLKVRIQLKRSEYPEWPKLRKQVSDVCEEREWELCSVELTQLKSADRERDDSDDEIKEQVTPSAIVNKYALSKRLNKDMTRLGLDILKDAQK